jgi:hypothetical protein
MFEERWSPARITPSILIRDEADPGVGELRAGGGRERGDEQE